MSEDLPSASEMRKIVAAISSTWEVARLACLDTMFQVSRSPVGRVVWLFDSWDNPDTEHVSSVHFQAELGSFLRSDDPSCELEALFKALKVIFVVSEMLPNPFKIANLLRSTPYEEAACETAIRLTF